MKTIQFRTDDLTQYTVNINQITCMVPAEESLGTWIYLSCGTRLKTLFTLDIIWEMINKAETDKFISSYNNSEKEAE